MNNRSFTDFIVGALACMSVLGFAVVLREGEPRVAERRPPSPDPWVLPQKRRRRRTPEDFCRHCHGAGACDACTPSTCRVCRGSGLQPRDETLVPRLVALWGR